MAHESRVEWFPYLREKLGDVPFSIDKKGKENIGIIKNCMRAWSMYDPTADFHTVIQDDALICDGFKEKAVETVNAGFVAYSFYFSNAPALRKVAEQGMRDGYIVRDRLHWGVAVCLSTALIPNMLEYIEKLSLPQDDARIESFLLNLSAPIYCPMPSLIDHRLESESLVGNKARGRQAMFYIDRMDV